MNANRSPIAFQRSDRAVVGQVGAGRRPEAPAGAAPAARRLLQLHVASAAVDHVDEHVELLVGLGRPLDGGVELYAP